MDFGLWLFGLVFFQQSNQSNFGTNDLGIWNVIDLKCLIYYYNHLVFYNLFSFLKRGKIDLVEARHPFEIIIRGSFVTFMHNFPLSMR